MKEISMGGVAWFQRSVAIVGLFVLSVGGGCGGSAREFASGSGGAAGSGGTGTSTTGGGGTGTGGAGGTSVSDGGADTTPPTVTSISPADGTMMVANNSPIVITFSEPMSTAATSAAISFSPAITCMGGWSWNMTADTATCTPTGQLASNTLYKVDVSTAATDVAGNALGTPFASSFTSGVAADRTPPTIVGVMPASNTSGVLRTTGITVTFSEPMDIASAQAAFSVTAPTGVMGTFTWTNSNQTMTFKPTVMFAYGAVVTFQVSTAAKDVAGNAKATTDIYRFNVIKSATTNFPCIPELDGSVNSLLAANPGNPIVAGDAGNGITARGVEAFDLTTLPTATSAITAATINMFQYSLMLQLDTTYGAAYLGDLLWWHVNFGPTFEGGDYNSPMLTHPYASGILSTTNVYEWKRANVEFAVRDDWANRAARGNRSEFIIRFTKDLLNNMKAAYAYLYSCGVPPANITYNPYLAVTYEYP